MTNKINIGNKNNWSISYNGRPDKRTERSTKLKDRQRKLNIKKEIKRDKSNNS